MKKMYIIFIVKLFSLLHSLDVFSQNSTDGSFLFKTWLFLESKNNQSQYDIEFPVKDSAVFSLFLVNVTLDLDTLRSKGFSNNFIFLSLSLNKQSLTVNDSIKALVYNKNSPFIKYFSIPTFCDRYVLCVNRNTGLSYRLQGFSGNDFFSLLRDLNKELAFSSGEKINLKKFLKNYFVKDIDFECIAKGLKSGVYDLRKYPCLYSCRGSEEIIWTQ